MLPVSCLATGQDVVSQTDGASSALLAAQARLAELRRQRQAIRQESGLPQAACSHGRFLPLPPPPQPSLQTIQSDLNALPTHLGWGSTTLTAVLRTTHQPPPAEPAAITACPAQPVEPLPQRPSSPAVIKLYPDLALAMLREKQTAVGRIWLILREIDEQGAGWVDEQHARRALTGHSSVWRVCGWRQLRNLLHQGDGVFWQWQNGRIWLSSIAKTAAALHAPRLTQRPVAVPVAVLTQGLGLVRAHFYASFHSSRQTADDAHRKPIARATLNDLSHVTAKTQRSYERQARVQTQANFAIGRTSSQETIQETGWRKGAASFEFVDHNGRQGKPGAAYVAWQLPNSYRGPHPIMARGRQKRINRELTDLFTQGMTGNGQQRIDPSHCQARRYFRNGRLAAQAFNQSTTDADIYWSSPQPNTFGSIWRVLAQP